MTFISLEHDWYLYYYLFVSSIVSHLKGEEM